MHAGYLLGGGACVAFSVPTRDAVRACLRGAGRAHGSIFGKSLGHALRWW